MDQPELPSDSDTSDEDFNPEGESKECLSEVDSESDAEVEEAEDNKGKKRKRAGPQRSRKRKSEIKEEVVSQPEPVLENEAEKKKRAESLWADFLKDCGPVKKKIPEETKTDTGSTEPVKRDAPLTSPVKDAKPLTTSEVRSTEKENKESQETTDTVVKSFSFAGESIKVEEKEGGKRGIGGGRGLASVLGQLKNKTKLSTLEKSKLDWESFKSSEGIDETIKSYNKGKNGYLEKQDFLERADLRQFEIEKSLRASRRSNR